MPNWAVEEHPKKTQIIKSLISGVSQRNVAKQYGLTLSAIHRYLETRLKDVAARAVTERTLTDGNSVLTEIEKIMHRMRLLYDACHEYLQDPKNPDKYFLGPHAEEVDIAYKTYDEDGKVTDSKTATLDAILKEIGTGKRIESIRYRYSDPRKLIIETADALGRQLELISKIQGLVQDVSINISRIESWSDIKVAIFDVTKDSPEIREALVARLAKIAGA
jgi:hypothetical protein